MESDELTVAVIGCGRLGQHYATAYNTFPDTELVAIAEYHPERRKIVGERFGVSALFQDAEELFTSVVPDVVAVVLPGQYIKGAVIAAAEAGVKGVSTDKPMAATLADADEMVRVCEERGVVFAGGNLQRAMAEVQEAGRWIRAGDYGALTGASIRSWGNEISGGGCQHVSVLRYFTGAEVEEVVAWAKSQEILEGNSDAGMGVSAHFQMSNGLSVPVFGEPTPNRGVDVWNEDALIRWDWDPPEIYQGFDDDGRRIKVERTYSPFEWSEYYYLGYSIRSFLAAIRDGSQMAVSGRDLRQALEVAIAAKHSALWGSRPLKLPLEDRSLTLYPSQARWEGHDPAGTGQTLDDASKPWPGYKPIS